MLLLTKQNTATCDSMHLFTYYWSLPYTSAYARAAMHATVYVALRNNSNPVLPKADEEKCLFPTRRLTKSHPRLALLINFHHTEIDENELSFHPQYPADIHAHGSGIDVFRERGRKKKRGGKFGKIASLRAKSV